MRAAFFDMDRTVLRIDSAMSWLRFLRRRGELSHRFLAKAIYWSTLYRFAVLDLESLASKLVADLEGDLEADMVRKCDEWLRFDLAGQIAPRAAAQIAVHRQAGEPVILLTGASQFAAEGIAEYLAIEHTLCSRLEVSGGIFTGRLEERCFGVHKVGIAERFAAAHGISLEQSAFYSDSYNDMPMLERVGEAVAVNPDPRLLRQARRRSWRIESWA